MILTNNPAIKIETIITPLDETNCYIVLENNNCVIIDCGGGDEVVRYVKNNNLNPLAILLTHSHFDHISGIPEFKKEFPQIKIYAHKAEEELLNDPKKNLTEMVRKPLVLNNVNYVEDNEILKFSNMTFKTIYTPGHTIGGACYYMEEENVLFSGDTLFLNSYGRYDFPTGDVKSLGLSINEKLMILPDNTEVFPGHGEKTNIKNEKFSNEITRDYVIQWLKGL